MNPPPSLSPPERTLVETVDGVTYRGHWFISDQVIVLYVGSATPLTKMILDASPEATARQLFREFVANQIAPRSTGKNTKRGGDNI